MAPRIYRLCEAPAPDVKPWPPKPWGKEAWLDVTLLMPHVRCPACNGGALGIHVKVPEAFDLAPNHPLLKRLRAIWRTRRSVVGEATWDEFLEIAAALRDTLGLDPKRSLPPVAQLEPTRYLVRSLPLADISAPFGAPLVSRRFVDWLEREGFTGWQTEPAVLRYNCRRPQPEPEMYNLAAVGSAGRPASFQGDMVCPMCGGYTVAARAHMDDCVLDEQAWDGSDIFRFGSSERIYVTERLRVAMLMAGFTTVKFDPSPRSAGPAPDLPARRTPAGAWPAGPIKGDSGLAQPTVSPHEGSAPHWSPREWVAALAERLKTIGQLPGCVGDVDMSIAPPLSAEEVAGLAAGMDHELPEAVARFWVEGSAGCVLGYTVATGDGVEYGTSIELLMANNTPEWLRECRGWATDTWIADDADEADYWANAFPIGSLGTGDVLGLDLRHGHADPPVVYLCHDGPSQTIAPSLSVFMATWLDLSCIDLDMSNLAEYLDADGYLSAEAEAVQALRAALMGEAADEHDEDL